MDDRTNIKKRLIFANIVALVVVAYCIYNSIGSYYFSLFGFVGKTILIGFVALSQVTISVIIFRLKYKGAAAIQPEIKATETSNRSNKLFNN